MKTFKQLKDSITKEWLEVKYFQEGLKQGDIAKILNCRKNIVSYLFKYFSIKTDNRYRRKYICNENYFNKWSANMAYILGFITCDGYIMENGFGVELNEKDIEVLKFIINEISPQSKIKFRQRLDKRTGNLYKSYFCYICSKKIKNQLEIYGIIKNKTGKEKIINIPPEFKFDYLRGIIDGDGTIVCSDITISNKKYMHPRLGICSSSINFLEDLNREYFDGKGKTSTKRKRRCYDLTLESRPIIIHLLNKVYNGNFHLRRKYEKFLKIKEYDLLMSTNKISIGTLKGIKDKMGSSSRAH